MPQNSHLLTDDIICPYCDHEFEASSDYEDDDGKLVECEVCARPFRLDVYHSTTYTTMTDCTGYGRNHVWTGPTFVYNAVRLNSWLYKIQCRDCELDRVYHQPFDKGDLR